MPSGPRPWSRRSRNCSREKNSSDPVAGLNALPWYPTPLLVRLRKLDVSATANYDHVVMFALGEKWCGSLMHAMYRQLTVAILLSSYLLATAATWLHTGHLCSDSGGSCRSGMTRCCSPHGSQEESAGLHALQVVCSDHRLERNDESSGEHRHQSDQCLLCRFLVIQKSAELPAGPPVSSTVLPQVVAVASPTFRVAELQATPDCRAPPHVC
jgi:hypothetical protein